MKTKTNEKPSSVNQMSGYQEERETEIGTKTKSI